MIQGLFLLLIPIRLIKVVKNDVSYALHCHHFSETYEQDEVPPVVLEDSASMITPWLLKLSRFYLSETTFPPSLKYANIQPVAEKDDSSNPWNCHLIALLSYLSTYFQSVSIFNKKVSKYLLTSDLFSGDYLALQIGAWLSFLVFFLLFLFVVVKLRHI